jgi:hypothetical protein
MKSAFYKRQHVSHYTFFPFMGFMRISHKNLFNEAMCIQEYIFLLIFSMKFLQRDVREIKYVDCVYPKLSHWVVGVFL